jgi:F-box protein 9
MHYKWQREITGEVLEEDDLDHIIDDSSNEGEMTNVILDPQRNAEVLLEAYSSSWQKMFRVRPRIRFNGVYISTVNYIRPGQASPSQITWNSPVHIVTYYRYLRFFRDGTVISLLTTSEPGDVVHFLTKNIHEAHTNGQGAHLPSAVMLNAAKGRWRLSTAGDNPEVDLKDAEGDVYVETEGVGKYIYRMELSLRSAGKGAKNNKLVWKAYWHYNKLSDDWGEFGLRNDKAFFWSRVKSYGAGE